MVRKPVAAEAAAPTPRARHPGRAVAVFLLAVLLGPPLGGLVVLGPFWLPSELPTSTLARIGSAIGGPMALGYLFGIVPACLAGLWIGARVWRDGSIGYLEATMAALIAALLAAAFFATTTPSVTMQGAAQLFLAFAAAALVAATACRWIAGRLGILEP